MYYLKQVLLWSKMENEVVVTRKGQTTIPVKLRAKYKIETGTRLEVVDTEEGILFKPKKSTIDLAGSGAKYATPEKMKKLLDKLREEDA
jgi:AbrB family looped-hinge helix DNA binding protein